MLPAFGETLQPSTRQPTWVKRKLWLPSWHSTETQYVILAQRNTYFHGIIEHPVDTEHHHETYSLISKVTMDDSN
jgi:hypothetical protein